MGGTNFSDELEQFNITICLKYKTKSGRIRRLTHNEVIDTLIHEWAHAMAWTPAHPSVTDHAPEWGLAYSKCYQAVIED